MLKDLLLGKTPIDMSSADMTKYSWDTLLQFNNSGLHFGYIEHPQFGVSWEIKETVADGGFHMTRSCISMQRNTIQDTYGLLGLSKINPKDTRVILTEGVSDYFTAKLMCPSNNVLGVTTLGGSQIAKRILINLFDQFIICADNDVNAGKNTGINNAQNWKKFLTAFGKQVTIFIPQSGCKDITENLMYNIRMSKVLQHN